AQQDIQLSGVFYCPHHPEGIVERFAHVCNCRKPQPGMLINAAEQLRIDLDHSWFIGDILDDIEAGNRAGCRTVLVDLGTEARPQDPIRRPTAVARNTAHALAIVAALSDLGPAVELDYQRRCGSEDGAQNRFPISRRRPDPRCRSSVRSSA
ncbi:MAG: HAD-IIIA family hydrolase, partial [Chloroflexaceae bacterium]|nr:HAD-IIIA family hydrolase [Chloroflexaceae bacterium]